MIVCPNCNHPNPDGAVQCEACYTPLPATTNCPSCGASVQADAAFCGQCGYNLHSAGVPHVHSAVATTVTPDVPVEVPPLVPPDPLLELLQPDALGISGSTNSHPPSSSLPATEVAAPPVAPPEAAVIESSPPEAEPSVAVPVVSGQSIPTPPPLEPAPPSEAELPPPAAPAPTVTVARTQLQQVIARLIHVQTDRLIELPQNLSVIHIGKPNDRIPPDIDVSGFPNSEVVSRIHADIRVEGDAHYVEDVGSSNGTYINNLPLLPGNRHRLRPGDRISLGKGDLMTFLFQYA
ncbi:FHA domain-containing protein [Nostoc sp. UCD121]|uniref:FHA domain-containing protein n=1 Tax=unclassified Nostoc TaxID=2593658 RepID=UPI0016249F48|nr:MULTISPECIES: FHA domain-containing protein [unclassified Nostoc]MBC1224216.1 FHA domain-containing protein [Nostoc sp. UCD120]MBC1278531.1 FHA domain-containing protein [Nostoc sp. UCD121]MBC1299274.1 FHA domain-containing protein [Nostoc sp. UCD122]